MAECGHDNCDATTDALMFVSERLCGDWRMLLRRLKVDEHVIDNVHADNQANSKEAAYQGLVAWTRSMPQPPTLCALRDALISVGYSQEAKSLLSGDYPKASHSKDSSLSSSSSPILRNVEHFVGRQVECRQIMDFCDFDRCKTKLVCVVGLPGIGKSELVNQALTYVLGVSSPKPFVLKWPHFTVYASEYPWALEGVAAALLEDLGKPFLAGFCTTVLLRTLTTLTDRHVLVLDVASLNLSQTEFLNLWNFIGRVLRGDVTDKLKVIATCCRLPEVAVIRDFAASWLFLRELSEKDSTTLLSSLCASLQPKQALKVYRCCGGIPILLRKLAAHFNNICLTPGAIKDTIRKLQSPTKREYVQTLMRRSLVFKQLNVVFSDLEIVEKEALVILSASPGATHESVITSLFDPSCLVIIEHLYTNHSIVEKSGKNFRLNNIVRDFVHGLVSECCSLRRVMRKAEVKIVKSDLDLLQSIVEAVIWNREPNPALEKRIQSVRKTCLDCKKSSAEDHVQDACACRRFKLLRLTFLNRRLEFLHALRRGSALKQCYDTAVDTALLAAPFLANILAPDDIESLFSVLAENCLKSGDERRWACVQATCVYASMKFFKCTVDCEENLNRLDGVFAILSKCRQHLSPIHLECLARTYLKRGHLLVAVRGDIKHGQRSIKEGLKIREDARERSDLLVAEGYGELADIYADQEMLQASVLERCRETSLIAKSATESDRAHPFLVTAFRKQGATYVKMGNWNDACRCYETSLDICKQFYADDVETMRAYRCVGNVLRARRSRAEAIENLKKAFDVGRKLLGDHEEVAQCCDDLILALGAARDSRLAQYEKKAAAIREAVKVNQRGYCSTEFRQRCPVGAAVEDQVEQKFKYVAAFMAALIMLRAWYYVFSVFS